MLRTLLRSKSSGGMLKSMTLILLMVLLFCNLKCVNMAYVLVFKDDKRSYFRGFSASAQWLMGDIHDWASCRCQLCLASQRLLLLVCNEKLGEAFSRACVRKLREVYIELLDEAESKSKEGVGRATYSTPAFKEDTASKGTATPSGAKDTKSQPSVKSERSEEEEDTSAAGGHREGEEEKASPESTPTKSGKEEKRKRSRSRHRRRRSSEKKSSRKDRSNSRGRSRHSRSNVRSKKSASSACPRF